MFSEFNRLYLLSALLILFIFANYSESYSDVNIGIEGMAPAGVQQTKDYDITLQLTNYSTAVNLYFEIEWTVTNQYDNTGANLDNTFKSEATISIADYSTNNITLGSYNFQQGQTYLIIAKISRIYEIVIGLPVDVENNSNFTTFYQLVNAPYTDIGAFIIDSPSPKGSNTADGLYATLINYGNNKLYGTFVKYAWDDTDQSNVITPVDTNQADWVPKYTNWNRQFFAFNPPIDSGGYVQIKVDKDNKTSDVIIVSSWKPNGQLDASGDDTTRAYFGDNLLGRYSISNNSTNISQFATINEAVSYLYSSGFYTDDAAKAIVGFGGGVQFYTRPGIYNGSVDFNGLAPNASLKNTVSLSTFSSDSTDTEINGDSGKKYAMLLNNMQYLAVKGFTFNSGDDGNVIQMTGNSNNFVISSSVLNAESTTSQDASHSVVYCTSELDSCSLLNCSIMNGSYGVYYAGSASNLMSYVGVSHCNFFNQTNAAISFSNHEYPFIIHNIIYNNRAEILNSVSPVAVNNRIYIDEDISAFSGQAYQSGDTKSALAIFSCSDTLSISGNNICIKNTNAYGLHLKSCNNQMAAQSSVVNNNSFQAVISPVRLESVSNLFFSKVSSNMTGGKTSADAGLYIDASCSNIGMARNSFNSSGGGYALILGTKSVLPTSNRDNLYSTGSVFANVGNHGDFSALNDFRTYMGFNPNNRSTNLDPQFYEDCDLIACNSEVNDGYQQCNQTDAPNHFNPPNNSTGHPLDVVFYWDVADTAFSYWLQVSTVPDFGGIVKKDDNEVQSSTNLIFNLPSINQSTQTVYSLDPNTKYYWRIRVCCDDNRSPWSETFNFTTGDGSVNVEDYDMEKVFGNLDVNLYPNPVNDNSVLEFSLKNSGSAKIIINDMFGRIISENIFYSLNVGKNRIEMPEILNKINTSGIYFIRIISSEESGIFKFVVDK